MKKIAVLIFLSIFLVFGSRPIQAEKVLLPISPPVQTTVDYTLPYAGILPDHPLYFLKAMRDKILDLVISDPVKRIEFNLLMADKRLVMARELMEKGENDLSFSTLTKAEKYFEKAMLGLIKQRDTNKESTAGMVDKMVRASAKHKEVVFLLMNKDMKRQKEYQKIIDSLTNNIGELGRMR